VNLHHKLVKVSAVALLLLATFPFTAPFAVCDLGDAAHSGHATTRHLTHASAVLRPVAKDSRLRCVLSVGITLVAVLHYQSDQVRQPAASQRPSSPQHLVLRL
jgi:hypothetical protein